MTEAREPQTWHLDARIHGFYDGIVNNSCGPHVQHPLFSRANNCNSDQTLANGHLRRGLKELIFSCILRFIYGIRFVKFNSIYSDRLSVEYMFECFQLVDIQIPYLQLL